MLRIKQGKNEHFNVPIKIIFQVNVNFLWKIVFFLKFQIFFPKFFPIKNPFSTGVTVLLNNMDKSNHKVSS